MLGIPAIGVKAKAPQYCRLLLKEVLTPSSRSCFQTNGAAILLHKLHNATLAYMYVLYLALVISFK